jgi:hypothetical protein
MESKIIGNKNRLAIEYKNLTRHRMVLWGDCSLWLSGYELSDHAGATCINRASEEIDFIAKNKPSPGIFQGFPTSAKDFDRWIDSDSKLQNHTFFTGLEGFDDFLKLCSNENGCTMFLWALRPDSRIVNRDVYAKYPKDVQQLIIKNQEIQQIADEFKKTINEILATEDDS